jgi:hypothetical protein
LRTISGQPEQRIISPVSDFTKNTQQGQADIAENATAKSSWWSRFFDMLRRNSSAENPSQASGGDNRNLISKAGNGKNKKHTTQAASGGKETSTGQAAQSGVHSADKYETVIDPTTTRMVAPPKPAVPLIELPIEQYVGGEEQKSHV